MNWTKPYNVISALLHKFRYRKLTVIDHDGTLLAFYITADHSMMDSNDPAFIEYLPAQAGSGYSTSHDAPCGHSGCTCFA